ncbi:MAG: hypothetical protein ACFB9M_00035 [Myxococcota bacterium]
MSGVTDGDERALGVSDVANWKDGDVASNANTPATASNTVGLPRRQPIVKEVLYSARDVEDILDASERTVRDLDLRWVRFGRSRMVLGEDLFAFIRKQR